jgi:hypothetical protein
MTRMKKKKNSSPINRVLPFHLVKHAPHFPYGGRICGVHLTEIYKIIKEKQLVEDELDTISEIHSFYQIYLPNDRELQSTNTLLISLEQSPLKSQTTAPLQEQAPSSIRRLTSKLRRAVSVAGNIFS